jgi:ATP-dependent helicase/nuclease subunit A
VSGALADAGARERAAFDLDSNLVVEAGAGTGKTTLLVDRLLFNLLAGGRRGPLRPREAVALTFTEKAASEIRIRLAEALGGVAEAAAGAPPDARSALRLEGLEGRLGRPRGEVESLAREALRSLDQAEIGTIHSFCAGLLRLFPIEAGVDPAFRVDAGGRAFDEIFAAEWGLWLGRELGEAPPRGDLWRGLLAQAGLRDLEALARGLIESRPDPRRPGGSGLQGRLRSMALACGRLAQGRPRPRGRILEHLGWMAGLFEAAAREAGGGRAETVPEAPCACAPAWPSNWGAEGQVEYERLACASRRLQPGREALFRLAVEALAPFVESFRALYRGKGWVGFDGLLSGARDLLRDHPRVRESLKRRYKAFLIDEFQDTDPLQGEILLFLAEEEGACAPDWRQTRPGPGKLFVVGDPKQSIYRFRGADMEAFESFTGHLERHGAGRCALATNFRSRPAIVAAVNGVFERIMTREKSLQSAYRPIAPAPSVADSGPGPVWLGFEGAGGRSLGAAAAREAEAEWIARWLRDGRGPFALRDVAIILRSGSALPAYLGALRRHGVPYAVEGEKRFFAAQEVLDFLNLLRALDDPSDSLALAGVLRSPLAALDDRDLLRLARRGGLDFRRRGAPPRELYGALRRLRETAARRPVPELVAEILDETPLVELAAAAYQGQQTASNLLKFHRLALDAGERSLTLQEFIAELSESVRTLREEGESPLADERLDAVRVLSVHKAKGLEFPVVILPNLSAGVAGGRDPAVLARWSAGEAGLSLGEALLRNAAMALAGADEEAHGKAEEIRVLYVAMTRAKERLILLGGGRGGFSAELARSGAIPLESVAAAPPRRAEIPASSGSVPRAEARAFARGWRARRAREARVRARTRFVSASSLGPFLGEERSPPPPGGEGGALLGRVCHAALERWDFRNRRPLDGSSGLGALVERCLGLAGAKEALRGPLSRRARAMLGSFLASSAARRIARSEILGREVPFLFEDGARVVRGTMDLLCREGGGYAVYDFKTSPSFPGRARLQEEIYRRAVEKALSSREVRFEVILLSPEWPAK